MDIFQREFTDHSTRDLYSEAIKLYLGLRAKAKVFVFFLNFLSLIFVFFSLFKIKYFLYLFIKLNIKY